MKNLFKKSDFNFSDIPFAQSALDVAVTQANKKLNALIESWPVVMSTKTLTNSKPEELSWHPENIPDKDSHYIQFCTHKARLAFVERIDKEGQCVHEPYQQSSLISASDKNWFCSKCGVGLQATWTEKK